MSHPAKKMSLLQATMLVAGNMIGTGVFLLPVNLASVGGIAVFGWIVATRRQSGPSMPLVRCRFRIRFFTPAVVNAEGW